MANKPINTSESRMNGFGNGPNFSRKAMTMIVIATVIILALIVWLCSLLHPLPPHTVTMATGPEGSSYNYFGKRYQILLAKEGIKVVLVPTAGGVENLAKLRDPKSGVDIGLVEGGIADDSDSPALVSLGTICYEPMWLFSLKPTTDRVLFALEGKRVSVGPEGSDSRALVDELLKGRQLDSKSFDALPLSPEDTVNEMLAGKIDAAILMSSPNSPVVKKLLTAPGVYLANFSRASAYVAILPSLYKLTYPEGAADLATNRPPKDTTILATKTSLIVRANLNPAIQYMLLETASLVHNRAGVLQKANEFPAAEALEIPLSSDARSYFKSGKPFLQRYLPFWLAALVEQIGFLAVPVLGLLYPLLKGLMAFYGWMIQRKFYQIYGELHWLERELDKLDGKKTPEELLTRMKHLEHRTNRIKVASKYVPMLYSLKENVAYVRGRMSAVAK
jgi:TRAP-type uncharacterized transport system substrate-binding protein